MTYAAAIGYGFWAFFAIYLIVSYLEYRRKKRASEEVRRLLREILDDHRANPR